MAIDLSFDDLALAVFTLNGRLIELSRFKTPPGKPLHIEPRLRGFRGGIRGLGGSSGELKSYREAGRGLGTSRGT